MAVVAQAITLPGCIPNVTCLQFGNFNVFSLPVLNLQATGHAAPGRGDPFFVSSTYGQIQTDTIIGINNGKCTNTGTLRRRSTTRTAIPGRYTNTPSPNNATNGLLTTDLWFGPVLGNQDNLGQNAAAFAIDRSALDVALASGPSSVLHVTFELA
jgi:hypothetical protein